MKILVTGSAGFIGYHLVKHLVSNNNIKVVGIDNINDYYDTNLKYDRLENLGINKTEISYSQEQLYGVNSQIYKNHKFFQLDITNLSLLEKLFQHEKFDCVINLAAQAGVRYSLENPHAYVQSNLVGFVNLLECCRYNKVKHFIYASSSSVYGANAKIPFSEDDQVDSPVSLYAATKKSNELMAYTYSHLYALPTTGLRFFTVYGPWGRPDMAPMLFANAIYNNQPINVFNNGKMKRDFTYIDDIVEGIVKLIYFVSKREPKAEVFNIGNASPIDLLEFISILEKYIGKQATKVFLPMQNGDVEKTWADVSKLKNAVSYSPQTCLDTGICEFIKWYNTLGHSYNIYAGKTNK